MIYDGKLPMLCHCCHARFAAGRRSVADPLDPIIPVGEKLKVIEGSVP